MNPDIWIVSGISPETRAQARDAAERSHMTPSEWVERAIRKTLFLDGADATDGKLAAPFGEDREVIRALAALEERLSRWPEWPTAPSPAPNPAKQRAPAPHGNPTGAEDDRSGTSSAADAEVPDSPGAGLAALAARFPVSWDAALDRTGPAPWVIAVFAAIVVTAVMAVALVHRSFNPAPEAAVQPATAANRDNAGLERAAAAGDSRAQTRLGLLYATGAKGPPDGRRAAIWLHRAAAQGFPAASFELGVLYERGLGVPRDPRKAIIHYRRAARENHAPAQHNLGVALAEGLGGKAEYDEARRWFQLAAAAGIAASRYSLGLIYERGLGIGRDVDRARALYRDAARMGDDRAKERLRSLASGDAASGPPAGRFPRLDIDAKVVPER